MFSDIKCYAQGYNNANTEGPKYHERYCEINQDLLFSKSKLSPHNIIESAVQWNVMLCTGVENSVFYVYLFIPQVFLY